MLNIVIGDSAGGLFRYVYKFKEEELSDKLLVVQDDLSLGPIKEIDRPSGIAERAKWLKDFYNGLNQERYDEDLDFDQAFTKTHMNIHERLEALNANKEELVIWHGPNAGDQVALRYLVSMIEGNQIYEVNLDGIDISQCSERPHYALSLGECFPEVFDQLAAQQEKMTRDRIEKLKNEWKYLRESSSVLRVMDKFEIKVVDVDHFDEEIIQKCTFNFEPAPRVIGRFLGETRKFINDAFIDYRLRALIEKNQILMAGEMKGMRDYCVKLKTSLAKCLNESFDVEPPIDSDGYQHILLESCTSKVGNKLSQRVDLDITPKGDWDQIDLSNKMILDYNLDNCLTVTWYSAGKRIFTIKESKVLNVEVVRQSMRRDYGKDVIHKTIRLRLNGTVLELKVKPDLELTLNS